jgi:Zn-dependent protease
VASNPAQYDDLPDEPLPEQELPPLAPPPRQSWEQRLKRRLGPLGVLIFAAAMWAAKLKVLLLAVTKIKFFGTAASGVVSIGAYALLWGWRFGVMIVLLLLIHELGHVVALRREGIPASAPMFIPFMGAFVGLKRMPRDAWTEAKVGLAGPLFGLVSSVAVLAAGVALDSDFLRAAAYFGFFINLFNLIPLTPLDGGRAAAAIHPYVWLAGAVGMLLLFLVHPTPLLILIAIVGGLDGWRRLQAYRAGHGEEYYRVGNRQRIAVALVYGGLAVTLWAGMAASHIEV